MFGPPSLLIVGAWKSGINVLLIILGVYSKTVFMIFPKPWHGLNPNLRIARSLDSVRDVLNLPRDKIHAEKCSRCLGPLHLMSKIIRANNRQTLVGTEAFEILAPFHKYLEEFYTSQCAKHEISLYYERRSKQYEPNNLLRSNYITLSNQIKAFVAMYFNEPINASQRYFGELLELYKSKLFLENHSGYPYFISGLTLNLVDSYFNKGLIDKSYKRFKYHILMLVRIILTQYDVPEFNSRKMEQEGKELISKLLDKQAFANAVASAVDIIGKNLSTNQFGYRNAHTNIKFVESLIPKSSTRKPTGTINYYNVDRGFGYIDINQPQDIFFHIYDYHNMNSGEPSVGEQLRFDIVETEKGLRAINIQSVKQ